MEEEKKIKPDFRVVAIDETHNWDEAITAITGRIAGIYLINFAEVTHICDLTGSYWAEFICNITENYIREPDGYDGGKPIWDSDWEEDADPADVARSKALEAAWGGSFYGLTYENSGEPGMYISERTTFAKRSAPVEVDPDSDDPARDALESVQEYMANGEEWADLAPWNVEKADA